MSTTNPNPFSSPAAQPQPSVMTQYPNSGNAVMPQMSPGQMAILNYRAGGGRSVPRGGSLGRPMLSTPNGAPNMQAGSMPVNTPNPVGSLANTGLPVANGLGGMNPNQLGDSMGTGQLGNLGDIGMTNANGVRVGQIRPPRGMMPVRAYR